MCVLMLEIFHCVLTRQQSDFYIRHIWMNEEGTSSSELTGWTDTVNVKLTGATKCIWSSIKAILHYKKISNQAASVNTWILDLFTELTHFQVSFVIWIDLSQGYFSGCCQFTLALNSLWHPSRSFPLVWQFRKCPHFIVCIFCYTFKP